MIDETFAVDHRVLLILGGAAEVAARTHCSADAADRHSGFFGCFAHLAPIDVLIGLDRNLDGIEADFLELLEKLRAFGGEGGNEKERIDAESHDVLGPVRELGRGSREVRASLLRWPLSRSQEQACIRAGFASSA